MITLHIVLTWHNWPTIVSQPRRRGRRCRGRLRRNRRQRGGELGRQRGGELEAPAAAGDQVHRARELRKREPPVGIRVGHAPYVRELRVRQPRAFEDLPGLLRGYKVRVLAGHALEHLPVHLHAIRRKLPARAHILATSATAVVCRRGGRPRRRPAAAARQQLRRQRGRQGCAGEASRHEVQGADELRKDELTIAICVGHVPDVREVRHQQLRPVQKCACLVAAQRFRAGPVDALEYPAVLQHRLRVNLPFPALPRVRRLSSGPQLRRQPLWQRVVLPASSDQVHRNNELAEIEPAVAV
mmetsp:Transcript_30366/g.100787  ORF Transcript_30366/g.100787 Transcript_30366/m.100787 type:complete len:299 (+) Transcript_30366:339-1235(+)